MLKIRFKDMRQEPVWVVEKVFTIGSATDNSLVIDDSSVEDYHARLVGEDDHFILQDIGSAEGTFVNGRRINQRHVGCQDTLRFGSVEVDVVDPVLGDSMDTLPYWALIGHSSWMAGQEFPLRAQASPHTEHNSPASTTVLIGRGRHCDIVFPGTHLSREHVRIALGQDAVAVTDLDSVTGTYINDNRITGTTEVRAGDRIRLDIYSFTLLGPGMQLPQSSSHPLPEVANLPETEQEPEAPKQWKTRPTSPGNREETSGTQSNTSLFWLSILLVITLIFAAVYLLLN